MVDLLTKEQPNRCAKMTTEYCIRVRKKGLQFMLAYILGVFFEQKVQRHVLVLQKRHAPFAGEEVEERVASETRDLPRGTV